MFLRGGHFLHLQSPQPCTPLSLLASPHLSLWPLASTSQVPCDHTGARPDKPRQPPISSLIQLHLQSLFATGGYRGLRHSPFRGCGSADQGRSKLGLGRPFQLIGQLRAPLTQSPPLRYPWIYPGTPSLPTQGRGWKRGSHRWGSKPCPRPL